MRDNQVIHLALSTDGRYLKHCAVTLTSVFENNGPAALHVHLIGPDLSEGDRAVHRDIVEKRYGHAITFYSPSAKLLEKCRVKEGTWISLVTYYRIFLGSILPPEIEKILYLDCDMIVTGDLRPLWDIDISGVTVAAVEDMWGARPENYERLHYPAEYGYFNAGLLLMNIARMRSTDFERRAVEYLGEHVDEFTMYDQDLLNAMLHTDKLFIAERWNVQDGFLRRRRATRMTPRALEHLDSEIANAVVVHYTGSKKPWHYKSVHPWRDLYYRYLDLTPWRGERPHRPLSYKVKLAADATLRALRIMKPNI